MKNQKILYGEYNQSGYNLLLIDGKDTKDIYSAGNSNQDSTVIVSPNDPSAVPLKTIRKFCIQTGKEMAKEKGWKWEGAYRISEEMV